MAEPERIWVPGCLFVSDDHELVTGRMAGLLSEARALRASAIGKSQRLLDLRHTVWLVERAALDDALIDEQAIVLPERLIDRERQPHAARWLARLPLVAVSGSKWTRLVQQDRLRLLRVAVDDQQGELSLAIDAAGGAEPRWSFASRVAHLAEAERNAAEPTSARDLRPPPSLIDRLLRHATGGAVGEDAVVAAWQAAQLCEPGYGYRGASDGSPASIEHVERQVRALDAVFAQIDARAQAQQERARAIVERCAAAAALAGASQEQVEAQPLHVPVYGQARRVIEAELRMSLGGRGQSYQIGGEAQTELGLPAYARWFVSAVDLWQPTVAVDASTSSAPGATAAQRRAPPRWLLPALALMLLAIAAVSSYLMGAR